MVIVLDVGPEVFFSFFLTFQCKICRLLTYIWGGMGPEGAGDGVGGGWGEGFAITFRSKCTYVLYSTDLFGGLNF